VGTVTEIHDYLRLLYARAGEPECPTHAHTLESQTVSEMVDTLLALPNDTKIMLLAPIVNSRKGEQQDLFEDLKAQGFIRLRIDGEIYEIDALPKLTKTKKHQVDVVVDRIKINPEIKQRMTESTETALRLADGKMIAIEMDTNKSHLFSAKFACPLCDYSLEELEPRIFSFNNPMGACPECDGLGNINFFDPKRVVAFPHLSLASGAIKGWDKRNQFYFQLLQSLSEHYKFDLETVFEELPEKIQDVILNGSGSEQISFSYLNERGQVNKKMHSFEGILNNLKRRYHETDSGTVRDELAKYLNMQTCPSCEGARLRIEARHVKVGKKNIHEICHTPLKETVHFFESLKLKGAKKTIAEKIIYEITSRLKFLVNVGLDYLSLSRSAETLSGGEAQRIRLASQIGSGLTGVMYVLDEPSIGLHQRDNDRLLETLKRLRDLGNTVIVVEHDQDAILAADHVVDIGPGAGEHGGYIVAEGTPKMIAKHPKSLTGQYISGRKEIKYKNKRVLPRTLKWLELKGAKGNNLKNVNLKLPIGLLTCVTGVSGSGKSSLINDTLYRAVAHHLYGSHTEPAEHTSIKGLDFFDKVVDVDQSPIGRTPRSNPATYTGLFTPTRELFAQLNESRNRGYGPGRFSFNVKGGRCEACEGDGVIKVEMHFLPDVYVPCDICQGKRYNRETLEIQFKGKNIHDVLSMTVEQAHQFFNAIPAVEKKLRTLIEVGLGYITLGQNATTLSGGEAQRVKLALELSKRDTGRTLYILDEPTTGLHFADIQLLLDVIHKLRDAGNTIVIIEHNLDVIKTADWVIDLGPEGGDGGGEIIAEGTPEEVANNKKSYTGKYLKTYLK
jgi:excinuclease ABC subunit A